ncbi:hypothetical protein DFJ77DRAFT_443554 [Powellomyces hirtus]|nr:hypothetical protein DFJ77DRAFT_443554 [Powellomyces hirtus]
MASPHSPSSSSSLTSSQSTLVQPCTISPPATYRKSPRPTRSWLALKRLQYEYTFGVYMMEPWEKAIFDAIVLMFATLFVYAIWRYGPSTANNLVTKTTYYIDIPETE